MGEICEKPEPSVEWLPWKYLLLVFPLLYQLSLSLVMVTVKFFSFFSLDLFVFCNNYWFFSCNKMLSHCHKKAEFGVSWLCFYKLHTLYVCTHIGLSYLYHNKETIQSRRQIHGKLVASAYINGPWTGNSHVLFWKSFLFVRESFVEPKINSIYKSAWEIFLFFVAMNFLCNCLSMYDRYRFYLVLCFWLRCLLHLGVKYELSSC